MGVGKTTVGRRLAAQLRRPVLDSDEHVLATEGETGRELAARRGVAELHRIEAQQLLDALADPQPAVLAAAASVVDEPRCLDALRSADVVWLRADSEVAVQRMGQGGHRRDLGPDAVTTAAELVDRRTPRYQQVADLAVDTADVTVEDTTLQVLTWLRSCPTYRSYTPRK
jgi:shikimate kinase